VLKVALAILLLSACSQTPTTPQGWTPHHQCNGRGGCFFIGSTPDGGHWRGFHLGMSHESAIHAACDAILQGQLSLDGGPIFKKAGKCMVEPAARDKRWAIYYGWSAKADGFSCWNGYWIDFQFNDRDGRLARIAAYCEDIDF
jgi:hypothetical protein